MAGLLYAGGSVGSRGTTGSSGSSRGLRSAGTMAVGSAAGASGSVRSSRTTGSVGSFTPGHRCCERLFFYTSRGSRVVCLPEEFFEKSFPEWIGAIDKSTVGNVTVTVVSRSAASLRCSGVHYGFLFLGGLCRFFFLIHTPRRSGAVRLPEKSLVELFPEGWLGCKRIGIVAKSIRVVVVHGRWRFTVVAMSRCSSEKSENNEGEAHSEREIL